MLPERGRQRLIVMAGQARAAYHHNIESVQRLPMLPERLPDQSLDAVARYCFSGRTARNGQTQARHSQLIRTVQHHEKPISGFCRMSEDAIEIRLVKQPCAPRKTRVGRHVVYGERRARPLARRALIIARPLLVAIRARKPCVRLRWRLLG